MEILADDLNVRTFFLEHLGGGFRDRAAEAVVLIDQVDFLDVVTAFDPAGHGVHLHVHVGVEAEVPERTALVGEGRVHRRDVQVEHLVTGVALVVLVDRGEQRGTHGRAHALGHVADAVVDRLLQLHQALLRIDLVVEADDFQLVAVDTTVGVDFLGMEFEMIERGLPGGGHRAGERVDQRDANGIRAGGAHQQDGRGDHRKQGFQHESSPRCCSVTGITGCSLSLLPR